MPTKTKITTIDRLNVAAQHAGLGLMTVAATLGMLELPDHGINSKVVVPNMPTVVAIEEEMNNNPLRREKEETEQHYVSYSVAQRTPGRSGTK